MCNPFKIRWLKGWTFQTVITGGELTLEAHGFGICLASSINPGESPNLVADRLVFNEDQRRKSLHKAWLRQLNNKKTSDIIFQVKEDKVNQSNSSLVIVN